MNGDMETFNYYNENIEKPFFQKIVNKYGWHLAHKAALEFFGYGQRYERFPHATLPVEDFIQLNSILSDIKDSLEKLV